MLGLIFSPSVKDYTAEDFINVGPELIDLAVDEILMTTMLDPKFYENKNVENALENAVKKGIDIRILLDRDSFPLNAIGWLNKLHDNGKIRVRKASTKIPHVIIIDELHLRKETEHEKGKYGDVKNSVIKNAYGLALKEKYTFFEERWASSEEIKKEKKEEDSR